MADYIYLPVRARIKRMFSSLITIHCKKTLISPKNPTEISGYHHGCLYDTIYEYNTLLRMQLPEKHFSMKDLGLFITREILSTALRVALDNY